MIFSLRTSACLQIHINENELLVAGLKTATQDEEQINFLPEQLITVSLKLDTLQINHCQAYINQ